ncbi:MAG: hypothetical protein RL701_232 [Pseudomonadota bacterium]
MTRQLGQGGMGSVWAAVHETLGREVAVKFLQPQSSPNSVLTDRFVSEAHMVAALKHRFVVDVFDYGVTDDGLHYMVLELLHGRSLAERMDTGPEFTVRQGVRLMADCLRGLHVVHEAGIIHRDLKPDNVFVIEDADGVFPKLIDFGISRRADSALKLDANDRKNRLTQPGTVLGTPYYMSPEQLRGKHIDRRADIYSVGVMLYELLVGRLPFRQDNLGDLMVAITVTGAEPLLQLRPELGEALSQVVQRAFDPNADRRPATALELREQLLQLLPHLPETALCPIQESTDPAEFTLSERSTLHTPRALAASGTPFAVEPAIAVGGHVARRLWLSAASVVALGSFAWLLARELGPRELETVQATELPTLELHGIARESTHAQSLRVAVEAAPLEPAPAPAAVVAAPSLRAAALSTQPAAAAVPATPPLAGSGADANTPTNKAARLRTRTRDAQPRPATAPDRQQKLYKKLDF